MPNVLLYTRPTINGRRKYVPADPKLKNNQGTFFLRYKVDGKDVWETTHTKTYTFALAAAKQKESTLLLHESKATPDLPRPKARLALEEQRDKFLELKELTKKPDGTRLDKETLSAYRQETEKFLSVCKKTYASEIDGMDLRRYMSALEAEGDAHRTIVNKYTSVCAFLKFCGIDHKELLPKGERPRAQDEDPEAYTLEEMMRFLSAVKRYRDRLFFEFLLKTGARMKEAIPSTTLTGSSTSVTISTEGITGITFFAVDNAGNTETPKTITVKLDRTPPTITSLRTPAANANGWNNSQVSVGFTCVDTLSGLAPGSPPAPTVLSTERANQSVTGTCQDLAGNSASATVNGISIDTTPPSVACSVTPNVLWPPNNQLVPVNATVTVADSLSGSAGFNLLSVTSNERHSRVCDGNAIGRRPIARPATGLGHWPRLHIDL